MTNTTINDKDETIYYVQTRCDLLLQYKADLKVDPDSLAAKIDSLGLPAKSVVSMGGQDMRCLVTL